MTIYLINMGGLVNSIYIYLGRRGGLNELTLQICKESKGDHFFISNYNEHKEIYKDYSTIKTFNSGFEFLFSSVFILPFHLLTIKKKIGRLIQPGGGIIFTGFHVWDVFFIWILANKFNVSVFIHDPKTHKGESNFVIDWFQKIIIKNKRIEIIALSNYSFNELKKIRNERISMVSLNDFFKYKDFEFLFDFTRPINLFFFGRIVEYKGFEKIPEILKYLSDNSKIKFKCIVRGQGDLNIANYIVNNSPSSSDIRIGWVSNEEVDLIMRENTITVLPYDEATQSGIIPIAMTNGSFVVATPVGALVEQLDGYRHSAISDDITATSIAKRILECLK